MPEPVQLELFPEKPITSSQAIYDFDTVWNIDHITDVITALTRANDILNNMQFTDWSEHDDLSS